MNKRLVYLLVIICGGIGSYVPALWHAGAMSAAGILGGLIGGLIGIWLALKLNNYVG